MMFENLFTNSLCVRFGFNRGMSNADRHRLIAQVVKDSGRATVPELAELTSASEMTIRRDLDTLAAAGWTAPQQ
jgi:DeoR family transcriptional regulator, fructose operon transcriptional repressor